MKRLIDADELMRKYCGACSIADDMFCLNCKHHELRVGIKEAPTIEAEPVRHGRWIDTPLSNSKVAKCSLCGFWQRTNGNDKTGKHMIHNAVYLYCAGCGARMDGGCGK